MEKASAAKHPPAQSKCVWGPDSSFWAIPHGRRKRTRSIPKRHDQPRHGRGMVDPSPACSSMVCRAMARIRRRARASSSGQARMSSARSGSPGVSCGVLLRPTAALSAALWRAGWRFSRVWRVCSSPARPILNVTTPGGAVPILGRRTLRPGSFCWPLMDSGRAGRVNHAEGDGSMLARLPAGPLLKIDLPIIMDLPGRRSGSGRAVRQTSPDPERIAVG